MFPSSLFLAPCYTHSLWSLLLYVKVLMHQRFLDAKEVEGARRITTLTGGLIVTLVLCLQHVFIHSAINCLWYCCGSLCEHVRSGVLGLVLPRRMLHYSTVLVQLNL